MHTWECEGRWRIGTTLDQVADTISIDFINLKYIS